MQAAFTDKDCNDSPDIVDGRPPSNWIFLTKVKDATFFRAEKRLSGKAVIPVDSRWSVDIDVRLVNELGSEPPGR